MMSANDLSEKLLYAVKLGQPTGTLVGQLQNYSFPQLETELDSDEQKKAFWINTYNAFFQILRREHHLAKPAIFREKQVIIAGKAFSLDDVEHGILRSNRIKWGLGYLPNPFAPAMLKKLAPSKIDCRIHFALNCGARGCPPVVFYRPDSIEGQLDLATASFLEGETEIYPDRKAIHVTRLFLWFLGDFGGPHGVRRLLRSTLGVEVRGYRLVFKPYDWEERLLNFGDEDRTSTEPE